MRYHQVINFEPLETVIQLLEADEKDRAADLVRSFVISHRMSENLTELVFPQLQYHQPRDNKGLFIVGNYGTGKSHLLSFISAVAQHADLVADIHDEQVAQAASSIAGKFKVLRTEIGAVTKPLRDIVLDELEAYLDSLGIKYRFPSAAEVSNNKELLVEMMAAFNQAYPQHGLLVVADELLDYLRGRKEQELVLDLGFLREVGEVCGLTRFRFVAGIQESLFDNPRFQFVASSIRRVKDRFEQVRIVRQDIAFVVANRLLRKNAKQRALIREHLQPFIKLYQHMSERLEDYVALFPIHPAYLEIFEQLYVVEQRQALKAISTRVRKLLDQEISASEPGIISFDSYWDDIKEEAALRSDPAVREVLDKSQVLENRIEQAMPRREYLPLALRIIAALCIHRLTTDDINVPLGMTANEMRDSLCLYMLLPEEDADFLQTTIESVLREIQNTVSGQFISFNSQNGQYYLDVKKDVDYDKEIELRADTLDDDTLNRYYYKVLARVMECSETTYVSGARIWQYELEWPERKVSRVGYLFFGAPNERSTAQPPRDFYLYFLQPFSPPTYEDEKKADEVFYFLTHRDDTFDQALRLFSGAQALAQDAAKGTKQIYNTKAEEQFKILSKWLRDNLQTAFTVVYRGVGTSMAKCLTKVATRANFRDQVNHVSANLLSAHFAEQTPQYPTFSISITTANRQQAAKEALRWIAGTIKTDQGTAVLVALELLDDNKLRPHNSRYAKYFLQRLKGKGPGQVLTRKEIIELYYQELEYERHFRLEPEWVVVIIASLIYTGDVVLGIKGCKIDAANIEELIERPLAELTDFRHIEPTKEFPLAPWQAIFELLDIPPGLIVNQATREEGIKKLQEQLAQDIDELVLTQQKLNQGLTVWEVSLLSEQKASQLVQALSDLKEFLETLTAFNTVGKLKNLTYNLDHVRAQQANLDRRQLAQQILTLQADLAPLAAYLDTAVAVLPQDHSWHQQAATVHSQIEAQLAEADFGGANLRRELIQALSQLKDSYQKEYFNLHRRARLGPTADQKKVAYSNDQRLKALTRLATIHDLFPHLELTTLTSRLSGLKSCFELDPKQLADKPICPFCSFRPAEEQPKVPAEAELDQLEQELDDLYNKWSKMLVSSLEDPTAQENIYLLSAAEQELLDQVIKERQLPYEINSGFIRVVQEVLSGMERVVVRAPELKQALNQGGAPCTLAEFQERFKAYVESITRGKDPGKVRIVLE